MPAALVTIRPLAVPELDRLEPLGLALHAHHVRAEPRLAGMEARSPRESWAGRRTAYLRWAQDPQTFALAAESGTELAGYAFVTVAPGYSIWDSGRRTAQLQTLSVAPAMRGRRVGERPLSAVRGRLAGAGIETLTLTAGCANGGAHRFYARHGFRRAEIVFVGPTATGHDRQLTGESNAPARRELRAWAARGAPRRVDDRGHAALWPRDRS